MTAPPSPAERRQNLLPNEVEENKEDVQLIWLDSNLDESDDCILTKSLLLELNPAAQFYSDFDLCIDLIKSIKDERVFLIVSGALAQRVLSQSHTHRTLVAIFIFCTNHQTYEPLMSKYDKIVEIFTDQESLLKSIRATIDLVEKQALTLSLFDQKQRTSRDLTKESASFLWHQMLLHVLKQMPQDEQSKDEMLRICRDYYRNNKMELKKIDEFEKNYTSDKVIEWYTDECFLYKLLNKALRTEDIELLYRFRFFIIDLCAAIEKESLHLKQSGIFHLYRGTQIPKEELDKLKESEGKITSTNGFLSTSRNMNVSLQFARQGLATNDFQAVLFEIEADPSLTTVIFADIENKTRMTGEHEVLFNLNVLFKIGPVNFDPTLQLWKVKLIATDEGSEKAQEYFTLFNKDLSSTSSVVSFGYILLKILGQMEQAEKYFNMLLKSLPAGSFDIPYVYGGLAWVHRQRGELNLALKNYELAKTILQELLSPDELEFASLIHDIGLIYEGKRDFNQALDSYEKALNILEKNYPDDHVDKATTLRDIGDIYAHKNDFDTALSYLSRALEMFQRILPAQHPYIATCLGHMGSVHLHKGDFDCALDFYCRQMDINEHSLPSDHPRLCRDLNAIVETYLTMGATEKALDFCRNKLNVQKDTLGETHPHIARTLMIMAEIVKDNDSNEALEYYQQARSILENSAAPDQRTYADLLTAVVCLYHEHDMIDDALQYQLQALDLYRQTLSSDHVLLANGCRNIGLFYQSMKNPSEALRYLNESLSIYRLNYGPEHDEVKKAETDIAKLNEEQILTVTNEPAPKKEDEQVHSPSQETSTPGQLVSMLNLDRDDTGNKPKKPVKTKTCAIL